MYLYMKRRAKMRRAIPKQAAEVATEMLEEYKLLTPYVLYTLLAHVLKI